MITIRPMTTDDASAVLRIYQEGIDTGHATFERQAPGWDAFDQYRLTSPRLVAENAAGEVCGWAVLTPTSSRCVYGGVAESTIYIAKAARGQGLGKQLLSALIEASEAEGIWTLVAEIFVENTASIALHEALGYQPLGVRRGLGKMSFGPEAGRWRDVLFLERRSERVGVD